MEEVLGSSLDSHTKKNGYDGKESEVSENVILPLNGSKNYFIFF